MVASGGLSASRCDDDMIMTLDPMPCFALQILDDIPDDNVVLCFLAYLRQRNGVSFASLCRFALREHELLPRELRWIYGPRLSALKTALDKSLLRRHLLCPRCMILIAIAIAIAIAITIAITITITISNSIPTAAISISISVSIHPQSNHLHQLYHHSRHLHLQRYRHCRHPHLHLHPIQSSLYQSVGDLRYFITPSGLQHLSNDRKLSERFLLADESYQDSVEEVSSRFNGLW